MSKAELLFDAIRTLNSAQGVVADTDNLRTNLMCGLVGHMTADEYATLREWGVLDAFAPDGVTL